MGELLLGHFLRYVPLPWSRFSLWIYRFLHATLRRLLPSDQTKDEKGSLVHLCELVLLLVESHVLH